MGDGGSDRQRPRIRVDRRAADVAGPSRGARRWGPWWRLSRPSVCCSPSPILILWCISPALAYLSELPLAHRQTALGRAERTRLREVARRTWRFFEELIGPADHWLVPDNYQEDRQELIAHRTSPTNIGLQLLSTLAACDFGYLSYAGALDRLEPTFDTLLRMQRYRGHFYNWYDTRSLAPLVPAYISTVDSGNLAGYLLDTPFGTGLIPLHRTSGRWQRARRRRGRDQPLRVGGRRAQPRARDERVEARAGQPAHAPRPPASHRARVAPAAHPDRRTASGGQHPASTTSRNRCSTGRRPKRSRPR